MEKLKDKEMSKIYAYLASEESEREAYFRQTFTSEDANDKLSIGDKIAYGVVGLAATLCVSAVVEFTLVYLSNVPQH